MKTSKLCSLLLAVMLMISLFVGCASNDGSLPPDASAPVDADADSTPAQADGGDYEEGTSDTDHIVHTAPADKVILVVSFGTSYNESRNLTIGGIETAIKEAHPDYQVRRAFTSQIIIDKLAERDDLGIDNVEEAMNRLVLDHVKEVVIQPTHVMAGFEYDDVIAEVMPFANKFQSFKIGTPLLADDVDYDEVAELMVTETAQYRADDTAIVFMGHGTEHEAASTYLKLQDVLRAKGYHDYIIGTVEHGLEIDGVQEVLAGLDVKKVILRPLMVVAGDHANNDMAGDEEDSWKTILEGDGYETEPILEGLGQMKGIQDIYLRHIQEALDSDVLLTAAPAASAVGVSANRIKNGTYSITVDSSSSMFKIVDCQLTVEDNRMWAVMTLSGQGFSHVYMGTGEEADLDGKDHWIDFSNAGEQHSFLVPVQALDLETECSGRSARKETWYDHMVVFESASIPEDAFLPCEIAVEMIGGTGKASIESPATLLYREGRNFAKINWSSPNYTYMIVNGVEHLPVNTDGNSVFEIPIVFDVDLPVIACTVAMSAPKEIAYTLRFDSASIQ